MTDKAGNPEITGSEMGCLAGLALLTLGFLLAVVGAARLIIHHDIESPAFPYEEDGDDCSNEVDPRPSTAPAPASSTT